SSEGLLPGRALFVVFFFQAEDGIRDRNVTGVQTCALPILPCSTPREEKSSRGVEHGIHKDACVVGPTSPRRRVASQTSQHGEKRSEERRVGKECRARWWACD